MILYHFTAPAHLAEILQQGLSLGDVPTSEADGVNAVWLTTDPGPAGHGLDIPGDTLREEEQLYLERHGKMPPAGRYDKRLVRIKVRISSRDPNLKHWPRWAKKRLQPDWYETLNQTGGGKAETWYLYFGDSGCGLYCRRGSQASTGVTRTPIEARRGRSCPFPHLSRNQYRTTAGMCEKPAATDA